MKVFIKRLKKAIALIAVSPLTLPELAARRITGRDVWFRSQGEIIALVPGTLGYILRNAYYHVMLRRCPLGCGFGLGTVISSKAEFGERVEVGRYATILMATIGDYCMIGGGVQILDGKFAHGITDPSVPFRKQCGMPTRVTVGRNCWIAANAVVMADIGDNCVVGAGAVVTRPFPSGKIIVGNPARAVVDTFDERLIEGRKARRSEMHQAPGNQKM